MLKSKTTFSAQVLNWAVWKQTLQDLFLLTKPRVTLLLVFTALATAVSAARPWFSPWVLVWLLAAGGLAAGGAASINQYLERELDARMPRTANRPLPSGRLAYDKVALDWGVLLCGLGVLLALITLPLASTAFILLGIIIYLPLYTLSLKRSTIWNVVIGGAAGSCPVLAGWAAVRADWPLVPIALAALVFFWTPAHFWAYAMCHVNDYRRAGFPMLPAVIGMERTPPFILANAYLAVLVSLLALQGLPLLLAAAAGLVFLVLCLLLWRKPGRRFAYVLYKASNYYLMCVFLGLLFV